MKGVQTAQVKVVCKGGSAAQVDVFQQLIVTEAYRSQVEVGVTVCVRSGNNLAQAVRRCKVNVLAIQARNRTDFSNIGRQIGVDFGIAQSLCNRAINEVSHTALRSDTNAVRAVFDDNVTVMVQSNIEVTRRVNSRPRGRGVASKRDCVRRSDRAVVFGTHVPFLIGFKLRALVRLIALHHVDVCGIGIVDKGSKILAPHIFNDKSFRTSALMLRIFCKDSGSVPCTGGLTILKHGFQIVTQVVTNVTPQNRIGSVESQLCADGINVLNTVGESQAAFVVVTVSSVVIVVLSDIPAVRADVRIILIGEEHVFSAVVDHAVSFRKQVMIQHGITAKVFVEFCDKLCGTILSRVVCVGRPVDRHSAVQSVAGGLRGVRRYHPR